MWWSVDDFFRDGAPCGVVGIRMLKAASAKFAPFVARENLRRHLDKNTIRQGEYILSETIPENHHKIQGEFSFANGQWTFYYSTDGVPMRQALRQSGRHAYGLHAWALLRQYATPSDVDDVWELFERFGGPSAETCVELTVTTCAFGVIPNRNTIIWEVRQY